MNEKLLRAHKELQTRLTNLKRRHVEVQRERDALRQFAIEVKDYGSGELSQKAKKILDSL